MYLPVTKAKLTDYHPPPSIFIQVCLPCGRTHDAFWNWKIKVMKKHTSFGITVVTRGCTEYSKWLKQFLLPVCSTSSTHVSSFFFLFPLISWFFYITITTHLLISNKKNWWNKWKSVTKEYIYYIFCVNKF